MSQTIKIRNFTSVVQYGDLQDLPDGALTELRNMRILPGKLVKSVEMGEYLSEILSLFEKTPTGIHTWTHSRLSASSAPVGSGAGFLYLVPVVNDTTKKLQIYTWNATSSAWVAIDAAASGIDFTTVAYYQTKGADYVSQANPIIQENEVLRFLPGYTAKPDGTNVAVGAWIGWIGRDYFDGLYLASAYTAKFFSYPREIAKPALTLTFTQHNGDGAFSPSQDISIIDMNDNEQTLTIAGIFPGAFRPGTTFTIHGNSQNVGTFKIESVEEFGELVQTKLWLDDTYHALVDHIGGYIKATVERESRWYKFSYIYDGIQESLLSEPYKIDFADMKFLQGSFAITKASHNMRITAVKVYRSSTGEAGTYRHIQTIDFLRKSGKFKSGSTGCYTGERTVYIPGLSNVVTGRNPTGAGQIKLWNSNTQDWTTKTTASYLTDTGRTMFTVTEDVTEDDFWDCAWEYYAYGTGEAMTASGGSGAFAGQNTMLIGENLGSYSYSGGVLYCLVNSVATYRSVDASYNKALHFTAPVICSGLGPSNGAWKLCRTEEGLWFTTDGTSVTFDFFDNGLPDGAAHPFEAETSICVNGAYAKMITGRLFQAKICLDPAGAAEQHPDWGSYSEPDQPDVTPMSNVIRFQDREGSELTGLEEMFGMAVFLMKQGIVTLNCKSSPSTPALWKPIEMIHNIGNVAPLGAVKAGDELYVCSWDGFYRLRPNNLANTDATPTAKLKISWDIDNLYNAMTEAQKQAIRGVYHPRRSEIHWFWAYTDPDTSSTVNQHWAYNVITGAWREIDYVYPVRFLTLDEKANAIALARSDSDSTFQVMAVETTGDAEDGLFLMRSKVFEISNETLQPIHRVTVIYKSPHALLLQIFLDGNDTATEEYELPAQATMKPYTVSIGYCAYNFQFVITDDTGEALVAEETDAGPVFLIVEQNALNPNVEIGGIDIRHS